MNHKSLSFFCSWLVVHLLIVLSVFLLFMTCGSFAHCINCLSSIRSLRFICPLYYLSFFCSWLVVHLTFVFSVFLLLVACGSFGHCIICLSSVHDLWFIWPLYFLSLMNHKSWTVERQIIQLPNEPQATSRRKTENTKVKWTTSHEQKKDR
jgi:ABC-type polysaccharide transport system permease subunit